jgi:hypothetical protein
MRQVLIVQCEVEPASLDEAARTRAGDGERRPLCGRVVNGDAAGIEPILSPKFETHAHGVGVSGRAGDEETILREPKGHAVIEHDA